MRSLPKLILSIVVCELVGVIGSVFTISSIPTWYSSLEKPFFAPPNWIFAPVWTLLYILMGIAIYLIWQKGLHKKEIKSAASTFLVQLSFNFVWSPIFFGMRSPLLGLIVIVGMWIAIVVTIKKFYPISHLAGFLLIPYLAWVSFATLLNTAILMLN